MPASKLNLLEIISRFLLLLSVPLIIGIGPILSIQMLVTLGYIPFLFLLSMHINSYKIFSFKPMFFYVLFFVISFFSALNARFLDLYWADMKTMLGTLLLGFAFFNFVIKDIRYLQHILLSNILATFILGLYLYKKGLLSIGLVTDNSFRVNDEVFNANMYAYFIYLATFSFFLLFYINSSKKIYYLYFVSAVFYILMIFLSGSRGGIIMFLLINILYWTYIGLIKQPRFFKPTMIFIGIVLLLMPLITYLYVYVFEHTAIGFRFGVLKDEGEDTIRVTLMKLALELFLKDPWLGVGAGNFVYLNPYHLFSHNNFTEILVNQGIFAFLSYILSFTSLFFIACKSFRNTKDKVIRKVIAIVLLFIISFLLYSFLYPFFKVLPFTGFIFTLYALVYRINQASIKNS